MPATGEAIGAVVPLRAGRSSRRLGLYAATALAVFVLLLLAPRILYAISHVTTDDAYVDTYPAIISGRVTGTVLDVPVREGQYVKRGQILVRLDDTPQRSELIRAQEAVAEAEAELAQALDDARSAAAHHSAEAIRSSALAEQSAERSGALRIQAQSDANSALAAVDDIAQARAALITALAAVPAAHVRLLNAQKALRRLSSFHQQGYISTAQFESAEDEFAQNRAAYQAAQSGVVQARSNLSAVTAEASAQSLKPAQLQSSARAEALGVKLAQSAEIDNSAYLVNSKQAVVRSQEARAAGAREALRVAEHDLAQMLLRSPVDGYVASRPATVGQTLQPGDAAVVVMPAGDLFVTANFKETQLDAIRRSASADIHVDSYPHVRFYGHVEVVGAAAQSALSIAPNTQVAGNFVKITQRVPVRITIDRVSGPLSQPLRPGMSAEVSIAH